MRNDKLQTTPMQALISLLKRTITSKYGFMSLFLFSLLLVACTTNSTEPMPPESTPVSSAVDTSQLRILWNQGFFVKEDEVIRQAVDKWQRQSGTKVQLNFISEEDSMKTILSRLETGDPPDIVFTWDIDLSLSPSLAWKNKLADVSDVIEPVKDLYSPSALDAVHLYNNVTKKRSYYAVPIEQGASHIFYWRDLLSKAGLAEKDIPTDWDKFWAFWKKAQDNLRAQGQKDIYGIGLPMSTGATDTSYQFEQALEAYDIQILNENGQLLLNNPQVRQDVIKVLVWYTSFYQDKYTPPSAVDWTDGGNNDNFLNRLTVMTPNPTLSIPASQRDDEELYFKKIATMEYPNKPSGEPMRYLVAVKHAIIFTDSKNKEAAKKFLAYLVQPENLKAYVQGSQGRWFPVMPQLLADPFWNDPADPHISVAVKQFSEGRTRPFYQTLNPAYSEVHAQNIWGKAIERVIIDGWSPERATDEAIEHIQQIFTEWK